MHEFGGGWTQEKLAQLEGYLRFYQQALKYQQFSKIYIDAFAGTGYRTSPRRSTNQALLGFPELDEVMRGSAVVALGVEPAFDKYIFIEKSRSRFKELRRLVDDYPDKKDVIDFRHADANSAIRDCCGEIDWRHNRAVFFLDPYGMQLEWKTLRFIAKTEKADAWILFPIGMGVDRLLTKDGRIPSKWREALNRILGESAWQEIFYERVSTPDLFDKAKVRFERVADWQLIERYYLARLRSIFPAVGEHGYPLKNGRGYLMYLLCFACANPDAKAHALALRAANHLLNPLKH